MALPAILDRLRTNVAASTGVSSKTVHKGRRYLAERADFERLHSDGTRIHAWYCYRAETEEEQVGTSGLVIRTHTLICDGYYTLLDPEAGTTMTSEEEFDTIIDAVCTTLRDDRTLNSTVQNSSLPAVQVSEWRQIGGFTCHRAIISIDAVERVLTS